MFYDLHLPWRHDASTAELSQTLSFVQELGYNVVALSHTLSGKLPADLSCPIPNPLPFRYPARLTVLRRCTLVLSDPSQNHRLPLLASNYDILAIRPTNEKSLQQACQSLECDVISLDLTVRLDFILKMKMLAQAVERGIRLEICYGPGVSATDNNARRNVISNAIQLIRATRGRGLIISSEASRAASCRGPWDVINLAAVWGLGQEKGKEAITKLARGVVAGASLKRTSFRGVVDVVDGGEKPAPKTKADHGKGSGHNKRKADTIDDKSSDKSIAKPISKREQKRRRKAELESQKKPDQEGTTIENSTNG